ncbi:hypothetical protein MLD38_016752 [Melastoma candidum]|uniref:Uncharacterized protein n=1 Tax=Melastoma candidum TaxID=119954 RepID=A0ACB9QP07_9MYRT|nr:hypothetical protein MLD38_016752 [Melastoma candidum]
MESVFSESDWDTFSESSEEMDLVYDGNALSLLSNLEESIAKIDDFLSFERGFILGDVVSSVTDPSGQMGRVIGLDMSVDLESTRRRIIRDISSKKLVRIRAISSGDYIVYGHWVGRVEKVVDSITVIFDDGVKSDFCPAEPEQLVPIAPNLVDDSQYLYYPEQRVKIRLASASRSVEWLCGSWKAGQEEGTVQSVKAGLLHIKWLASALVGCGGNSACPPKVLKADDVTLLSCLEHASWQLGDWCMLVDHEDVNNKWNPIIGIDRMLCTASEIYTIARKETRVDVVWQDGSHSFGMESQSLLPVNIVDTHEFWPEQFVLEKKSCQNLGSAVSHKFGIVRAMDTKEKTVKVIWRNASAENNDTSILGQYEETVSAYELMDHPDYSVCIGDVVFKMIQNEAATVEVDKPEGTLNPDADCVCLSCFGNVIGFKDGYVEIKWAHGREEKVSPSEIIRVDKHEVSSVSPVPLHGDDGQTAQRMADRQTDSSDRKKNDLLASADADEVRGMDSSFSVSQYALGLLSGVASGLLGAFGSRSMGTHKQSAPTSDDRDESLDSHPLVEGSHPFMDAQHNEDSSSLSEAHIDPMMMEVKSDSPDEDIENRSLNLDVKPFKQFDMVTDCSDHHFFNNDEKGLDKSQVKRRWLRKIQQEWNILEKNLPETIYVRVYEERMDLLRAAIVGPPGTPYHDGLFFFDIFLPPDYPNEPPMVHYRSGGLCINPNLYESGKVCLSLLNTWTGSGSEVWKPESSTILQVLVSLQALVLNDKPYFNEAGYDNQVGKLNGEKNSTSYNENTFLLNCQSMLYVLHNPPRHFEALVDEHFGNCFRDILLACKDYIGGAPVGFPSGNGNHGLENNCIGRSSTGFKIMLAKLQASLTDAFVEKGMERYQFLGA